MKRISVVVKNEQQKRIARNWFSFLGMILRKPFISDQVELVDESEIAQGVDEAPKESNRRKKIIDIPT